MKWNVMSHCFIFNYLSFINIAPGADLKYVLTTTRWHCWAWMDLRASHLLEIKDKHNKWFKDFIRHLSSVLYTCEHFRSEISHWVLSFHFLLLFVVPHMLTPFLLNFFFPACNSAWDFNTCIKCTTSIKYFINSM